MITTHKILLASIAAAITLSSPVANAFDTWSEKKYESGEVVYSAGNKLFIGERGVGLISFTEQMPNQTLTVSVDGGKPQKFEAKQIDRNFLVLENSNLLAEHIKSAKTVRFEYRSCSTTACMFSKTGGQEFVKFDFENTIK